jgi:hypothetical protein
MKPFLKQLRDYLRLFHFDWKSWFLPQYKETRTYSKAFNIFFGALFGIMATLTAIVAFPDIKRMVTSFSVVVFMYIAFCAIMRSLKVKKSNSGRNKKQRIDSFPNLFVSLSDFDKVDRYVNRNYSKEGKMRTCDVHCLLEIIIKEMNIRDKSLDPMITLFAKQYPDVYPPDVTNRAITKAKIYEGLEPDMKNQLFQNSSKIVPKNN